jgi:hypothetical protein
VRTALCDISADEGEEAFYNIAGCECTALVRVVDILDRVEARLPIVRRRALLTCDIRVATRRLVAGLGNRYHGRIQSRLGSFKLLRTLS